MLGRVRLWDGLRVRAPLDVRRYSVVHGKTTLNGEINVTTFTGANAEMTVTAKTGQTKKNYRAMVRSRRARGRVGGTTIAQLRWLVDFAQDARSEAEVGRQLATLRAEISALAIGRGSMVGPDSAAEVISLRDDVRRLLTRWSDEGTVELRSSELGDFSRYILRSSKGSGSASYYQGRAKAAVLLRCADLIEAEGSRVARCQRIACGRLFVRVKRGAYCSRRCSQRVRSERFRTTHEAELRAARHDQYREKVRRDQGRPKLEIKPRPRRTAATIVDQK